MPRNIKAWSLNAATISLKRAREYAEKEFSDAGKSLDEELPDFDKNFNLLKKKLKKALDIPRIKMPVIEPEDMALFNKRITEGSVDVFKPYARGHLMMPEGFSGEEGEEWVHLGFQDGNKTDDQVKGKITKKAVKSLFPTQSQIWFDKLITNILKHGPPKSGSPILSATVIVSKDMYILDGHHRFGQAMLANPSLAIKSLFIPLPIDFLLQVGKSYGEAIGNSPKASLKSRRSSMSREDMIAHRVAKSLTSATKANPAYMRIIEDLVEDMGVDAVEDSGEFNDVDVRSYGMKNDTLYAEGILPISLLESTGAGAPGGSKVDSVVEKVIENANKDVYDWLKGKYPEQMGAISFQDMHWDAMEEVGLESEYEDAEVEKFSYDYDFLVVSCGAYLNNEPDDYHRGVGKATANAQVVLGSPGKTLFFVSESVDFTDEKSLKKNLAKALRKVGGKL